MPNLTPQEAECLHYIEHCGLEKITTADLSMKFGWSIKHAGVITKRLLDAEQVERQWNEHKRRYEYQAGDGEA